jgi:hypothetical protein
MLQPARALTAALVAAALLLGPVGSAGASATAEADSVPVVVDALLLRPLGFGVMCLGFLTYAVGAPIMAITRPTDMHRPFNSLVILPARFVFVDPLGRHPDRVEAESAGAIR